MSLTVKKQILDKIKAYDKIIIVHHIRPDGDAVGSTLGFKKILKLSYPEKEILVVNDEHCDYVAFLGEEDGPLEDDYYKDALVIALDTATYDRISNKQVSLAKELIKIDHHIDIAPYGDLSWVDDSTSSVCEMITDFYVTFKDELKIDLDAATCLFTGITTDSGRFKYQETTGRTLRMAAELLDLGVDTQRIYAELYLEDFDYLKFQSYVFNEMKITENGVAYVCVDDKMQKDFNLSHEQASNTVSLLQEIKGSIIWIAFIDNPDGTIRVRLRSRFVTINELAEQYGGGGHANASGATLTDRSQIDELLAKADVIIKEYKANNFYL